jgi:signal peptidase I
MLFPKANVPGWKGLVPGMNFAEWCKLIGQSPWHALWLLFPVVNIFTFCGMAVDMVRSFRMYKLIHSTWAVIYAPAIFFYIARNKEIQYDGPTLIKEKEYKTQIQEAVSSNNTRKLSKLQSANPYKKTAGREWFEAIVFAVFAAAFIRMFLIEAYKIPTPSMEGSLLVGDFLFVSKAHYGMRMPMTPQKIPLLHNRVPLI